MKNKLSQEFITYITDLIDCQYEIKSAELKEHFHQYQTPLARQLKICLNSIMLQYEKLQAEEKAGELRYIYFSFMRTSLFDGTPLYYLDFYDSRDRISETECGAYWDFSYITEAYREICVLVQEEFRNQTRVKEYESDSLIYDLAERFHTLAKEFLPAILAECLDESDCLLPRDEDIQFMIGEYLDWVEPIVKKSRLTT